MDIQCEKRGYSRSEDNFRRSRDYAYAYRRARATNRQSQNLHKYDLVNRAVLVAFRHRSEELSFPSEPSQHLLRLEAERLRPEFTVLAERWRRDTRHLS